MASRIVSRVRQWPFRALVPQFRPLKLRSNLMRFLHSSTTFSVQIPSVTRVSIVRSRGYATPAQGPVKPGDTVPFRLADIGEGIAEVEIMKWFVKPGDTISQFQKVCEVQSDKATVEITSRYDGVVKSLGYETGQMAKVGQPLLHLVISGTAPASATGMGTAATSDAPAKPLPASAPAPSTPATTITTTADEAARDNLEIRNEKVLAAPAVRRIAREQQVDLSLVTPTGPGGRIVKEDILAYLQDGAGKQTTSTSTPVSPAAGGVEPTSGVAAGRVDSAARVSIRSQEDKVEKISGIARIMVQTMTRAASVPTFLYCDEIVVDELINCRNQLKPLFEKQNIKLSFMPFIIKAASLAMLKYPRVNSLVNQDCTELTIKGSHNIGVAMDTPRGLLVPNIKNVQDKSILEISEELTRLQGLGAANKLGQADLTGGTFTLSNIGTIGGTYASPILVVPEVAIGALGKFQVLPRYNAHKELKPVTIMNVSWCGDHRVLDGATIANFSNAWKRYIESPMLMLADSR